MKKNAMLLCLIFIAFALPGCDGNTGWADIWPGSSVETALPRIYQKAVENGFVGVILVRHRGKVLLHEAAGMADRELKIPNTVDTVFAMGSITKQYTAALIMALQEAGQLTVDDKLADHLNGVPKDKADITIHQLLTHTSGIRRNIGEDTVAISRDVFLSLVWATPLESEPGSRYMYSNAAYNIAAAIAEVASGESYEIALRKHVLNPAELDATGYLLPAWSDYTLATGHNQKPRRERIRTWWAVDGPYWNLRGSGGLLTTTSDLLKWHDVLSGESVLSRASIKALQARHVDTAFGLENTDPGVRFYGYGWVTKDEPPTGLIHWHSGSNKYVRAFIGRAVEHELVIIGLANDNTEILEDLVDDLGEAVIRAK